MALLRLIFFAFVALSVIYVSISLYSRAVRRDKLREAWFEEGSEGDREAYVKAGLKEYDGSFRRRLILLVYIVPLAVVAIIHYVVNYT